MSDELRRIRDRLDEVDRQVVGALAERERIIAEVAALKIDSAPVRLRDVQREQDLLTRIVQLGREAGADPLLLTRLYQAILEHSVRVQQQRLVERDNPERPSRLVVAYQGTRGAYSHQAAERHFATYDADVVLVGHDSFESMLEAVRRGKADRGVLPIENTTAGSINEAYDLLARMDLSIVGEEIQPVEHCLIGLRQAPVSSIRRVFSHPQALLQCSRFLASLPDCHAEAYVDTAGSCEKVRDEGDVTHAAIASELAAQVYGLVVLERGIANQRENFTRMVVVAREPMQFDTRIPVKTSVVFATRHEHGALLSCLNVLAAHSLNLTKLESRPRPHTPWQYLFYADFEGNTADPNVRDALRGLRAHTGYLKVLGSYPSRTAEAVRPAEPRLSPPPMPVQTADEPPLEQGPFPLASRAHRDADTVIRVGHVDVGNDQTIVLAGPPAPGEATEADLARVRAAGAHLYVVREGWALDGAALHALGAASAAVGIPVCVEVRAGDELAAIAEVAHALLVGSRHAQDLALLGALGRVDRPVVLVRSPMDHLDEWLAAAEVVLEAGNQQLILCDPGVRLVAGLGRTVIDPASLAEVRERVHLPLLVAPGAACESSHHLGPLCLAAVAGGAQGVLLTVGDQADLDLAQLAVLSGGLSG